MVIPAFIPALLAALAAGEPHIGLIAGQRVSRHSHSRLREMLLGGVTRHILKNASARPVLLAH
jgi:hypothetical protein